jgi:hypothetical protein
MNSLRVCFFLALKVPSTQSITALLFSATPITPKHGPATKDNTKPEGKQRYTQPPQLKMSAPPTHHLGTLAILLPELREIIYEKVLHDVRVTYASRRGTTNPIPLLHVNHALRSSAISIIKRTRIVKLYAPTSLRVLTSRHPILPRRIALWPWSNIKKNAWKWTHNGRLKMRLMDWRGALASMKMPCRCEIAMDWGWGMCMWG